MDLPVECFHGPDAPLHSLLPVLSRLHLHDLKRKFLESVRGLFPYISGPGAPEGGQPSSVGHIEHATHKLEHELGGLFDVAHGAGLAAIWGTWARYVWEDAPERFEKFALEVMEVEPGKTAAETVERGIQAMEAFYREIHMPTNLRELGVKPTEEQIAFMARSSIEAGGGKIGTVKVLTAEDAAEIYRRAL